MFDMDRVKWPSQSQVEVVAGAAGAAITAGQVYKAVGASRRKDKKLVHKHTTRALVGAALTVGALSLAHHHENQRKDDKVRRSRERDREREWEREQRERERLREREKERLMDREYYSRPAYPRYNERDAIPPPRYDCPPPLYIEDHHSHHSHHRASAADCASVRGRSRSRVRPEDLSAPRYYESTDTHREKTYYPSAPPGGDYNYASPPPTIRFESPDGRRGRSRPRDHAEEDENRNPAGGGNGVSGDYYHANQSQQTFEYFHPTKSGRPERGREKDRERARERDRTDYTDPHPGYPS